MYVPQLDYHRIPGHTPSYRTRSGLLTTSYDPMRLVFAAACGYWTDDFSTSGMIPVWWGDPVSGRGTLICPFCHSPGFVITAYKMEEDVTAFEESHPFYTMFMAESKARCYRRESHIEGQSRYDYWIHQLAKGN